MCEEKFLKERTWIEQLIGSYHHDSGSLIPILQKTQEHFGYLSKEYMVWIAQNLHIPPAKVFGVATFYTQFRLEPVGKYLILLCQGTACHVNGAAKIQEAIEEELHIRPGETDEKGVFTLNTVACLGCCSLSPVMMIGEETYGSLTPEKTKKILRELAEGETA